MRTRPLFAAVLGLGLLVAPSTVPAAPTESLRPAVGKPLQEAQKLIQGRRFKEALAPIAAAEKVAAPSAYESFVTAQMKGAALAGAGDAEGAAAAFEQVLAARRLPRAEQLRVTEAVASAYLRARRYPKAAEWLQVYRAEGGASRALLDLLPQAYYQAGDYRQAAAESQALIAAAERAGARPAQEQLRLLAASLQELDDRAGHARSLEKLVRHYPTPAHWADVIQRSAARPGFSRDLELDRYRLLRATGNLRQAGDYLEVAQLALQAGLPGEAKAVMDEGYRQQVLGVGDAGQTGRQDRLRALVEKQVADGRKPDAPGAATSADAAGGEALVRAGLAAVTDGRFGPGLALMEQGMRRGPLKLPQRSRLHLGYAYYLAGDKPKALAVFREVDGDDGAADLARLWSILAAQD